MKVEHITTPVRPSKAPVIVHKMVVDFNAALEHENTGGDTACSVPLLGHHRKHELAPTREMDARALLLHGIHVVSCPSV